MIKQTNLDRLVKRYETEDFIKDDPVRFPHRFTNKKDIEIAGFIASLVAYGRRDVFVKKLDELFDIAQNEPYNFITNFEPKILGNFNYRFGKPDDFSQIFSIMKELYLKDGGLEELFEYGYKIAPHPALSLKAYSLTKLVPRLFELASPKVRGEGISLFTSVCDYFYSRVKNPNQGFTFMIPNPRNGGAMKRMCMYLRWMVRKPPVDFGIWNFMPLSDLYIPLDVHVARISREMGLLTRKQNDFKAVIELTENLKKFDPKDPVKYDFAMFGYGINEK